MFVFETTVTGKLFSKNIYEVMIPEVIDQYLGTIVYIKIYTSPQYIRGTVQ